MSQTVLVITGGGKARYMTISGDPSKYGLVDVPKGRIVHEGKSRLMTFTGRPKTPAQRAKKPNIPLSPVDLPSSAETNTLDYLSVLDTSLESTPVYIMQDEVVPGVRVPKYLPRDSVFIAMVEWPLRPGDTRIEAYFIGTNSTRQHWFLMECTVDDLSPYNTKYLSRHTTAMVEKGQFKIQEAAILLLKCVWQHEKETWDTPAFCIVSDCGLLDLTTIHEIADKVWPD